MIMNNNKKRRQPKTIWDFLRECPLVSTILLSVIGYTLYALVGAMGGEYKLRISKDHTLFMSAMIKEDPFVKKMTQRNLPMTRRQPVQTQIPILFLPRHQPMHRRPLRMQSAPMEANRFQRPISQFQCVRHALLITTIMTVWHRQPTTIISL